MTTTYSKYLRFPVPDFLSEPWSQQIVDSFTAVDVGLYQALTAAGITNWANNTVYAIGNTRIDTTDGTLWMCSVSHTSAAAGSFATDRAAHPTYWNAVALSIRTRGQWLQNTGYALNDLVYDVTGGRSIFAMCTIAHTSTAVGTIITDTAKWVFIFNGTGVAAASAVTYDHTVSALAATNVQAAIDEVVVNLGNRLRYDAAQTLSGGQKTQAQTNLGLGSAAVLTAGTAASNALQLDGSAKIPAVDGSQLTNIMAPGAVVDGHFVLFSGTGGKATKDTLAAPGLLAVRDNITALHVGASAIVTSAVMINGTIVQSQSGGAQTFALKTLAGTDPTAADPVYFIFRNVTPSTGNYTIRTVAGALSITIPSGQATGFVNATPGGLWILALDNAGTVELAIVNCATIVANAGNGYNVTGIYSLRNSGLVSTTAIAAAPSSGVVYSTTARAGIPCVPIARVTWEAGNTIAVAGTWGTAPTRIGLYVPGVIALPGDIVQKQLTVTSAVVTGSTTFTATDVIPQNTMGDQYIATSITPASSANCLEVGVQAIHSNSSIAQHAAAIFQDAVANALGAAGQYQDTAGVLHTFVMSLSLLAGLAVSTTFKLRMAGNGGTITLNGSASARLFGGVASSRMEIREIAT